MPPLSFLFLLLLNFIAAVTASPAPLGCPNYACGNVAIRYPFWVSGNDTGKHCGYDGSFRLECRRGMPVLHLPSGEYGITAISYGNTPVISAFDMALINATCPHVANRSLLLPPGSPPLLSLTARNRLVTFLVNCSFTGIAAGRVIPCLQDGHNMSSFYFPDGRAVPHRQARLCQEVVSMPVLGTVVDDVLLALSAGFELTWTPAAGGPCRACEQAGGFCGQRRGRFHCFKGKRITLRMIVCTTAIGIILLISFSSCFFIHLEEKRQAEAEAEADTHGFLQDRGSIEMEEIRHANYLMPPVENQMPQGSEYTRLLHRYRRNRTTRDDEIESQVSPPSSFSDYGGEDDEDEAAAAAQHRRGKEPVYG